MIENYFLELLQKLFVSPAVSSFKTVKEKVQEEDGYIRIKCRLQRGHRLEFAEYVQAHGSSIVVVTYNYHWQDAHGVLVRRWDNVPHHRGVDSFPHHLHISEAEVIGSGPTTLQMVLREIEARLLKPV
ncbi:toxin-antitoxin system TumE family protein [Desulfoferrobacter suflitae]|uniref:toxin-antitoxin system TumE family protein n=1 Tax=Desulfoferrobacter suflitae TaxID=2865782 RepID=UPI0021643F96|nr:DUF6516 family protein [Desulfoferrobacter suflitae]MCK8603310.1 DUF6516 family protein [Desulfoferrobacter suflitae]